VNVTATSVADPKKKVTAVVTILPTIVVNISPSHVQVSIGTEQQFSATVTGTSNTAVTWTLSGTGCNGNSCGTLSATGLYSAPGTVPTSPQIKITATSKADTTKSASATVTIIRPLVITISPLNSLVALKSQRHFFATVRGSLNGDVTWSVAGAGCSGSECGTITADGLYTAPASLPNPASVTIKAASQAAPTQSATATINLIASNNEKLNGQYAFQFKGLDNNGVYQITGSFTADGDGNLRSGLEDVNNTNGVMADTPFTGTYQIGGDGRGTMTITDALDTSSFKFVLDLLGNHGRFIELDNSGVRGSGVIERQDPTAFTTNAISGSYAINLTGMDWKGKRIGAVGQLFCNSGFVSIGSLDVNDGGVVAPTFGPFSGDYKVQNNGRGVLDLNIPGFDGGSFKFAIYITSANKFLAISLNTLSTRNPVFSGPAELQTGVPFSPASFKGASVFNLSGNNGTITQASVGQVVFNGTSGIVVTFDQNTGGTITTGAILTGAYAIQLNGRGTLDLDNNNGSSTVWYMYAISPNRAFLLDASTSFVMDGELEPQSIGQQVVNSDLVGPYLLGSGELVSYVSSIVSGASNFDGISSIAGTEDISRSTSVAPNQSLLGTYSLSTTLNNGRGSLLLTSPVNSTNALWITGTSTAIGLSLDHSNTQPVILHFEQ